MTAGAAVAKGGVGALVGSGFLKISLAIVLSPALALGVLLMTAVAWMFYRTAPHRVDRWLRLLQLVSASLSAAATAATTRRRRWASLR